MEIFSPICSLSESNQVRNFCIGVAFIFESHVLAFPSRDLVFQVRLFRCHLLSTALSNFKAYVGHFAFRVQYSPQHLHLNE